MHVSRPVRPVTKAPDHNCIWQPLTLTILLNKWSSEARLYCCVSIMHGLWDLLVAMMALS